MDRQRRLRCPDKLKVIRADCHLVRQVALKNKRMATLVQMVSMVFFFVFVTRFRSSVSVLEYRKRRKIGDRFGKMEHASARHRRRTEKS